MSPVHRHTVLIRWVTLLFLSASFYAFVLVLLAEGFKPEIGFLAVFISALIILPASMALGVTLYLSGFGEKRILHMWDICLLALPIVVFTEYITHFNDISVALAIKLITFVVLLPLTGLGLDPALSAALGVSGGFPDCLIDILVCNETVAETTRHLESPIIQGKLGLEPVSKFDGYLLESVEEYGFNWFVTVLPDSKRRTRSVIMFIAYAITSFNILSDEHTRTYLSEKEAYFISLLQDEVDFDGNIKGYGSYLRSNRNFAFISKKAIEYALRPTEIPFTRIVRVPSIVKALLAAIGIPLLFLVLLYWGGFISQENLLVILVPTIVLIGLELFAVLFKRKEQ